MTQNTIALTVTLPITFRPLFELTPSPPKIYNTNTKNFFAEPVLRDLGGRVGAQRPADQRPGHDIHSGQLLQLHGRHGHLLAASVRGALTGRPVPRHVYRHVSQEDVQLPYKYLITLDKYTLFNKNESKAVEILLKTMLCSSI